jgi:type III secretion protein U
VGTVFSLEPSSPKLENLNPVSGLKKLFSKKSLVTFLMMCAKTAVVGVAVALLARQLLPDAIRIIHGDMAAALEIARQAVVHFVLWCGAAFLALAAADFGYQRWQFSKDQMMSKTDVKRESKEDDGDPHLKSERKRVASEESAEEMLQHMRVASLVLRDYAGRVVVVIHRPAIYPLPVFLLRASGPLTTEVLAQARQHRLKVADDAELVARVYGMAAPGAPVPGDLVDTVLAHLQRR